MAKQTFTFSTQGLNDLQDFLIRYKQNIDRKSALYIERLAEIGLPVIEEKISQSLTSVKEDLSHQTYIKVTHNGNEHIATLILEGEQMVFVEFGAGIHYNTASGTSPHPKGDELGFTIGSYGQGQGNNDSWFYYDSNGELVETYGTQATMPMYSASLEIANKMFRIAKEVFKNG